MKFVGKLPIIFRHAIPATVSLAVESYPGRRTSHEMYFHDPDFTDPDGRVMYPEWEGCKPLTPFGRWLDDRINWIRWLSQTFICEIAGHRIDEAYGDPESGYEELHCNRCSWSWGGYHG